jgi:hypothetical protein
MLKTIQADGALGWLGITFRARGTPYILFSQNEMKQKPTILVQIDFNIPICIKRASR